MSFLKNLVLCGLISFVGCQTSEKKIDNNYWKSYGKKEILALEKKLTDKDIDLREKEFENFFRLLDSFSGKRFDLTHFHILDKEEKNYNHWHEKAITDRDWAGLYVYGYIRNCIYVKEEYLSLDLILHEYGHFATDEIIEKSKPKNRKEAELGNILLETLAEAFKFAAIEKIYNECEILIKPLFDHPVEFYNLNLKKKFFNECEVYCLAAAIPFVIYYKNDLKDMAAAYYFLKNSSIEKIFNDLEKTNLVESFNSGVKKFYNSLGIKNIDASSRLAIKNL